jgi:hypothetical protein
MSFEIYEPDMENHVCANAIERHERFMLALAEDDEGAYWNTWSEIHRCPDYLRDALQLALRHCAGYRVEQAGSRSKAADAAAAELGRLMMP